jgi:hypothetical protein
VFIRRLWSTVARYFKNGWSDCKNALMKMVNMLSDVEWCWVMLSDVEWCWVMLSDVEWCLNWNVQFLFLNGSSWDATLRWNTLHIDCFTHENIAKGIEDKHESNMSWQS